MLHRVAQSYMNCFQSRCNCMILNNRPRVAVALGLKKKPKVEYGSIIYIDTWEHKELLSEIENMILDDTNLL